MKNCPCNSGKEFKNCCEPYIQGIKKPPTAEALMRSRYSAYVVKDIAYIEKTNDPNDQEPFDFESAKNWAESAEWLGLEIIDNHLGQENDDKGEIEFKARFKADGKEHVHHERSLFIKRDDQWFFEAGKIVQMPDRRTEPKIGRNDPCKCGSGKKYKKCCGN